MKRKILSLALVFALLVTGVSPALAVEMDKETTISDYGPEADKGPGLAQPLDDSSGDLVKDLDPKGEGEAAASNEDLAIGEETISPPVGKANVANEDVHITSAEDLLKLIEDKYYSGFGKSDYVPGENYASGDEYHHVIENKNIILDNDITLPYDKVSQVIPQNLQDPLHNNGISLLNSNFNGNGHTITITKGDNPVYSLFNAIKNETKGQTLEVKDLTIVYESDVLGSGFARKIDGDVNPDLQEPDCHFSNIQVDVQGSILPHVGLANVGGLSRDDAGKDITNPRTGNIDSFAWVDSVNLATGISWTLSNTNVEGFTLNVAGNIGSQEAHKHDLAITDVVRSHTAGLFLMRSTRHFNKKIFTLNNITLNIGGGMYAKANGSDAYGKGAYAVGAAYDLQPIRLTNFKLNVGKDIQAIVAGKSQNTAESAGYSHVPILASGVGHDIFHVKDAEIKIGGSIQARNDSDVHIGAKALGIGAWCYIDPYENETPPESDPFTVDHNSLEVGGDIKAESTKKYKFPGNSYVATEACAGVMNSMSSGLDNNEYFKGNTLNVKGDIIAKATNNEGNSSYSRACLWGNFAGDNNTLSANSIQVVNEHSFGYAAPFVHYLKGEGNSVSLNDGISIDTTEDEAGGFALAVSEFDGSKNTIHVKKLLSKKPASVGGFASRIKTHDNHKDPNKIDGAKYYVAPHVKNVNLSLDGLDLGIAKENAYVGGFVARNLGLVENSRVKLPSADLSGDKAKYFGGFVGFNTGDGQIHSSTSTIKTLRAAGTGNNFVGGFVGWNSGTIGEDGQEGGSAYIGDMSVEAGGSTNNVGGFVGQNRKDILNSSACLTRMALNGNGNHYNLGGFAGYEYGSTVKNAAAYINDSIHGQKGNYVNIGGFTGIGFNTSHENNAAQVGEDILAEASTGPTNAAGYAGKMQEHNGSILVDKASSLVFGQVQADSTYTPPGRGLPNINAGFIGQAIGGSYENSAAYVGLLAPGILDKAGAGNLMATPSLGFLQGGQLSNFTVLSHDDKGWENYVMVGGNSSLEKLHFVHIQGSQRTAYPVKIDLSSGDISLGDQIGEISIAPRAFQDAYWEKDASKDRVSLPYENFAYVTKNDGNVSLTPILKDAHVLAPGQKAGTLTSYCNRHVAIQGNQNNRTVTYDILGLRGKPAVIFDLNYEKDNQPAGIYTIVAVNAGQALGDEKFPAKPVREGYIFKGWNIQADGQGRAFAAATLVKDDLRVYAQWARSSKASSGGATVVTPLLNKEDHFQYMIGYEDESFRPENKITRQEVAVMFSRLLKDRPEKGKIYSRDYHDVPDDLWSATGISYMSKLGIVKGYPDGSFKPQGPITRAEFAAIATRFDHLTSGEKNFTDVSPSHWAYNAIGKAAEAGWIKGYPDGSFKPDQAITRAEVVAITNQVLNRYADEEYINKNEARIIHYRDLDRKHWAYYKVVEASNGHQFIRKNNERDEIWKEINEKSFVYDK
ncbi:S-layer homology domain-containing protein [Peptococcus simiae]|uniref:S-layer homology domain-containing protein n=1 Tax=Peptococcus simiae TaxID=1643805 RepID=UPI00397F4E45